MALEPGTYLYLVETETGRVLERFSLTHLRSGLEIHYFELQLRRQHGVDDPESGLDLIDSAIRPE